MDVAHAGASLWLSDWSKDYKKLKFNNGTNSVKFNKYERLGIYSALGMSQYIFNLFCELSYLIMLMKSAKYMQATMLSSILRSNMQWFEATPVGRIINRFSKDIQIIESLLPNSYRMVVLSL
jgi:ATP-binding cassette subfamily C (CFTR/MRP) protein 1